MRGVSEAVLAGAGAAEVAGSTACLGEESSLEFGLGFFDVDVGAAEGADVGEGVVDAALTLPDLDVGDAAAATGAAGAASAGDADDAGAGDEAAVLPFAGADAGADAGVGVAFLAGAAFFLGMAEEQEDTVMWNQKAARRGGGDGSQKRNRRFRLRLPSILSSDSSGHRRSPIAWRTAALLTSHCCISPRRSIESIHIGVLQLLALRKPLRHALPYQSTRRDAADRIETSPSQASQHSAVKTTQHFV
jgi:hypothetical protein